jgi:biotin carboxyl carrier protein
MKHYRITIGDRRFDVRLLSDPRREKVEVEVNGQNLTVEVKAEPVGEEAKEPVTTPTIAAAPLSGPAAPSARTIVAPLPGTVKSVAIRSGQEVTAGEELLVIEAMKMDNIIRAPRPGIIDTVYVGEGKRVAHGELILEYRA